tara:strand:+ start:28 stop:579 length:552 start_codon:yes stop_codon:yes gene_type:complete
MALTRLGLNQSINLSTNTTGNLNLASQVTGTLATGNGGTGATSFAPGKVLQVLNTTRDQSSSTSSSSFVDINSGFKVDITPSSTGSKILIWCHIAGIATNSNSASACSIQVLRDSTSVAYNENIKYGAQYPESFTTTITHLDAPNTLSQITYKPQFRNRESANVSINISGNDISEMVVMEIAS